VRWVEKLRKPLFCHVIYCLKFETLHKYQNHLHSLRTTARRLPSCRHSPKGELLGMHPHYNSNNRFSGCIPVGLAMALMKGFPPSDGFTCFALTVFTSLDPAFPNSLTSSFEEGMTEYNGAIAANLIVTWPMRDPYLYSTSPHL
jgi:hypothetical protein